jgi:dihydroorotate dehydrogenase (NAD+) catalytic subunit
MGGITSWEDAIEFILAGASAVGVGTGLFRNPLVVLDILEGITTFMRENGIARLDSLRGQVVLPS